MMQKLSRLLPLVAILAIGCGGGGSGDALQVTGTVKNADGSTLDLSQGGLVLFMPVGEGTAATGNLNADGSFSMMTKQPGDGMKPGAYKVLLQIWKDYRAGTLAVPQQYGDASTTPLEATVDADHTHFDFQVEK
jgi:hypothetical protein